MMASQSRRSQHRKAQVLTHCRAQNDYLFGFVIGDIFIVISLQEWVGWEIFTVILARKPRRASGAARSNKCAQLAQLLSSPPFFGQCSLEDSAHGCT